ncbi:MAG TPA: hypothetical protein VKA68_09230 [bacterium]|nr:hypothetical protein [bacterium]
MTSRVGGGTGNLHPAGATTPSPGILNNNSRDLPLTALEVVGVVGRALLAVYSI